MLVLIRDITDFDLCFCSQSGSKKCKDMGNRDPDERTSTDCASWPDLSLTSRETFGKASVLPSYGTN